MCGILGLSSKSEINKELFKDSLLMLKHRGPDFQDFILFNNNNTIGHTRLSILDLDNSNNQPFNIDNYSLVFNGEIYNYIELRNELKSLGHKFRTEGDTEVVIRAYIEWNEECLNKFNGMWAFVIYNKIEKTFFCSRDRFGIKPFYYSINENYFIFSSEIKPILNYFPSLKKANKKSIYEYYINGSSGQNENSFFKGIKRLKPSSYLIVNNNKIIKYKKYWEYPSIRNSNISFEDAKFRIRNLLIDSVKIRLRSDVDVSSTITSGIDSTTIVSLCNLVSEKKLSTYTSFNEDVLFSNSEKKIFKKHDNLNESFLVKEVENELNIDPTYIKLKEVSYYDTLYDLVYKLEGAHSSQAIVSVENLYSEVCKRHRVLLEGQGADELFGGYVFEFFPKLIISQIKKLQFLSVIQNILEIKKSYSIFSILKSSINNFLISYGLGNLKLKIIGIDIVNFKFKNLKIRKEDPLKKMHTSGLVNLLQYGDVLSMSNSIETRFPFLDYRLVEECFRYPLSYFFKDGQNKFLLREAAKDILPKKIYQNNIKLGFISPTEFHLKNDSKIKELLYQNDALNFFNNNKLKNLLDKFYNNNFNEISTIYKITLIKLWIKIFMEDEKN